MKKREAAKAFRLIIRTPAHLQLLTENTREWIEREFASRQSKFVPYPASFLRSGQWEEPPPNNVRPQLVQSGAAEALEAMRS